MTDYELHREEWIEERCAILEHEAEHDVITAMAMARFMWNDYQASKTAQEPANDLD